MSNKLSLTLFGAIAFLAITGTSHAETLLGKNYIGASFGIVQFGDDDIDDVIGNAYGFSGVANINLNPNFDLNLGGAYVWADGEESGVEIDITSIGGGADLIYSFKPNEQINPYIGAGITVVKSEIEVSALGVSVDEDDTEIGFGAGAGIEIEATEEVLLRVGLNYYNIDSEDSIDASISLGYWFSEKILCAIGGNYDFDTEDAIAEIGIVVKL
jgi:opacity protein-like surface antigen